MNHSCAENMYLRLVGTTITPILYQKGSHSETKMHEPHVLKFRLQKVITPVFRPLSDICRIIGLELSTSDIFLCVSCYQDVWHYFHCCQSCGAIPKTGKFYHHCPDPERISSFLQETSGGNIHLKRDDCLCLTCYLSVCDRGVEAKTQSPYVCPLEWAVNTAISDLPHPPSPP